MRMTFAEEGGEAETRRTPNVTEHLEVKEFHFLN